ncbi:MAG: transcription antitermination factor NusB [Candidatus Aegiribacteria sp.]|nr:transcription antitermination factor NusB [Candidatus Aegiribacteria sp.]MBD3295175.1 transcription antitermination factor NusB [Candidatus Fermentibacteria bacterium]
MGVRNRGRKALLQARFASELNGRSLGWNLQRVCDMLDDGDETVGVPLPRQELDRIRELADAIDANRETIDQKICEHLRNWSMDRLSLITRLILEQAVAELFYCPAPVPPPVVLDEAVELARQFETGKTAGFVNGVLDSIVKESVQ